MATENKNVEIRYNDTRLRSFRIANDGIRYGVQTQVANYNPYVGTFPYMIKIWHINSVYLHLGSHAGARETWTWSLTLDQVKDKLTKWRKTCTKEKLINVERISFTG